MAEAPKDQSTEVEAQIGAVGDVSLGVGAHVVPQTPQGEGSIEDVVAQLGRKVTFNAPSDEGAESVAVEVADDVKERLLTPEVQAGLLGKLKQRFDANVNMHIGVSWTDVQRSLEADPAKLWSLQEMENSGHLPDVYMEDDGAYYFGTCCPESPEAHRNIVFDAAAQEWLRTNRPQEVCNGNAVDIAAAMGIDLMDETQYRHLQTLGRFDAQTWSWLKTLDAMRKSGFALYGDRGNEAFLVFQGDAGIHLHSGAFRGSLRVSKA